MEEWKEYKLGEFMQFNPKERIAKGQVARKIAMDQLVPFCRDVSSNIYEEYKGGAKFKNGDTIMARITPCLENGKTSYISSLKPDEVAFGSTEYIVLRNIQDVSDSRFVYYLSICPQIREVAIKSMVGSSGRQRVQQDVLENYCMNLPSLPTQQKIANILSSLDDKIEVNRRINEQLEELAQALFKSWFVDFEPFKDGEFVESELGMIPEGWKVGTLGDVCEKITDGSHYSPKDNPKSIIPMLSVKDMQKYSFDYSKSKHIDEEEYAKMKSNDCVPLVNDILVAKDGSYLKEIFICKKEIKQAILSSIAIFRANKSIIYPMILLCILKSPRTLKNVSENFVSGSALPRIVLKDFKRYSIVFPPLKIQSGLNDKICAIYDKIYANEEEITHLTNLRDTLLPKLMSGEIDVNEVEI